jgi:imidazole glycerol-phosphate synthase subunit HisH
LIGLIDYGMGNLRSVQKAFERCGAKVRIVSTPKELEKAEKIILPGVGAFSQAMLELKKRRLVGVLKDRLAQGTPYLGLCLGLQLLFPSSEEGSVKGLGILPGTVKKFRWRLPAGGGSAFGGKVPHMGWNTLQRTKKKSALLKGVKAQDHFYFVHSFYAVPHEKEDVLTTTGYGVDFCSSIQRGNIFATQFHPEKSQEAGLRVVRNFIAMKDTGCSC